MVINLLFLSFQLSKSVHTISSNPSSLPTYRWWINEYNSTTDVSNASIFSLSTNLNPSQCVYLEYLQPRHLVLLHSHRQVDEVQRDWIDPLEVNMSPSTNRWNLPVPCRFLHFLEANKTIWSKTYVVWRQWQNFECFPLQMENRHFLSWNGMKVFLALGSNIGTRLSNRFHAKAIVRSICSLPSPNSVHLRLWMILPSCMTRKPCMRPTRVVFWMPFAKWKPIFLQSICCGHASVLRRKWVVRKPTGRCWFDS